MYVDSRFPDLYTICRKMPHARFSLVTYILVRDCGDGWFLLNHARTYSRGISKRFPDFYTSCRNIYNWCFSRYYIIYCDDGWFLLDYAITCSRRISKWIHLSSYYRKNNGAMPRIRRGTLVPAQFATSTIIIMLRFQTIGQIFLPQMIMTSFRP